MLEKFTDDYIKALAKEKFPNPTPVANIDSERLALDDLYNSLLQREQQDAFFARVMAERRAKGQINSSENLIKSIRRTLFEAADAQEYPEVYDGSITLGPMMPSGDIFPVHEVSEVKSDSPQALAAMSARENLRLELTKGK